MPGMPVSEQNCHPFQWGRFLWCALQQLEYLCAESRTKRARRQSIMYRTDSWQCMLLTACRSLIIQGWILPCDEVAMESAHPLFASCDPHL